MADLISRQAAIDAFKKELSAKYNGREFAIGFVGVESILENVPSAQRWIPVTERLPEEERYVIATDTYEEVVIARRTMVDFDTDEEKEIIDWWLDEWGRIKVTAWMPLPEPYKGGEHEAD